MSCIENMPGRGSFEHIKLASETGHQIPEPGLNSEDAKPMQLELWECDGKVIPCLERLFRADEDRLIGIANVVDASTQLPGFLLRQNDGRLPELRFKIPVCCLAVKTARFPMGRRV